MALSSHFRGLALGATMLAAATGTAEAGSRHHHNAPVMEPATSCSSQIDRAYQTGPNTAVGFNFRDGCVYTRTGNTHWRATHNFNMQTRDGRNTFETRVDNAQAAARRYEDNNYNQWDRNGGRRDQGDYRNYGRNDGQRCANAIGGLINGNNPLGSLLGAITNCQ